MLSMRWAGAVILTISSFVSASVLPTSPVIASRDLWTNAARDVQCTNGPDTRACWSKGFSIATDFDKKWPSTGNTVTYNLVITNGTCNPDGHGSRLCFLVNGQYPGPVVRASWGDTVVVNVQNRLKDNGTTIHFHGIRQLNTCGADGTNGITQCPIAPGNSMTYTFHATQYGTSWYHSHFSSQYGDGVFGPVVIDGPATANYDVDLGTYLVNDWIYITTFQMNARVLAALQAKTRPPPTDTILINGTNKNSAGGGSYNHVNVCAGKRYRLRLVNPSVDNYIRVSLDSHPLLIIAADFVPVNPISVQWLSFGPGQRYDVVIAANQTASSYWFRAEVVTECSSNNFYARAVWTYDGAPASAAPNSTAFPTPSTGCAEPSPLAPFWVEPVPSGSFQNVAKDLNVSYTRAQVVPGVGDLVVLWSLDPTASSMNVQWDDPSLSYVRTGNTSYPPRANVIPALQEGKWNYWLIQQSPGVPSTAHPIHLHGHDFFVLGQGNVSWTPGKKLNWATPTRRDTATIPGGGYLAIAFRSNNPGTWLMHCHIAWHVSEGFGMQFFESTNTMTLPNWTDYDSTCNAWSRYKKTMYYPKIDSGL